MSRRLTRRRWLQGLAAGLTFARRPSLAAAPLFEEVPPASSGIDFVHENAMSAAHYLPETVGPGCCFFDYDNDGWMDIYVVNSGPCDFFQPKKPLRNALYRNNRDGTFTDVTGKAGVPGGTFGMGCAAADYDNDGHADLLVTSYGRSILYHNNGDGTFTDVTERAGVAAPGWHTSAVWFDYNGDGLLDLFLCSFVEFDITKDVDCGRNRRGERYYCIPRVFPPTPSKLYRNNGDGTFTLVSKGTEIERALGKALGVVAADVNNDRRMDLFVANDTVQNFLFLNRGDDRWEEAGLFAEVAFSADGKARSGMGVDSADFDQDGLADLFVANVDQETFSLYRNLGDETFQDTGHHHGIAQATRLLSGWGLKFFDFDNDGNMDLLLANGHPDEMIGDYSKQVTYREPLLLFQQREGKFHDVSRQAGPAFQRNYPARGLAVGDFDNDGAVDVLVANNGEAPLLLRNRAAAGNHWIGLHLEGVDCNRDAVGAKVSWVVGNKRRTQVKTSGGSYLASHDPRVVLGLGKAAKIDHIEIEWPLPSNRVERLENPPLNRYLRIIEGRGLQDR